MPTAKCRQSFIHTSAPLRAFAVGLAVGLAVTVGPQLRAEPNIPPSPYQAGEAAGGELRFVNHVPLLILRGGPEDIARQEVRLCRSAGPEVLRDYPKELIEKLGVEGGWDAVVASARKLLPQIPQAYRTELQTLAEEGDASFDNLLAVNTFMDSYRGMLGCSSLMVEPTASATGGALFGRNLDFFAHREMSRYTIVKVYRANDNRLAFASVGFPGIIGVLTGINEAGLTLAIHEVRMSADGSPAFNPEGMPYAMAFRRVLETCRTCDEAIQLLRKTPHTSQVNLALSDRGRACVVEITPKTVAVRNSEQGLCACTNHFRTPSLSLIIIPWRYAILSSAREDVPIDVAELCSRLDRVNQRFLTVQSMVFEQEPLVLHLAYGKTPATELPYRRVDLRPLLESGEMVEALPAENRESTEPAKR